MSALLEAAPGEALLPQQLGIHQSRQSPEAPLAVKDVALFPMFYCFLTSLRSLSFFVKRVGLYNKESLVLRYKYLKLRVSGMSCLNSS